MNKSILKKYAKLIVGSGVNLKKGETLVVSADICSSALVRAIAERAYQAGAAKVIVRWADEALAPLDVKYQSDETLESVPTYEVSERDAWADGKFPFVAIVSSDPDLMADLDAGKVSLRVRARAKAFKRWRLGELSNEFRWTIAAYPSEKWARKVFPDLTAKKAVQALSSAIIKAARLDAKNPIAAWKAHSARLAEVCKWLNNAEIKELHYKNSLGTDLKVKLPDNYVFMGGSERDRRGRGFNANIPSEEVFSAPRLDGVDGIVYGSMPLCRNGRIIDKLWLKLEKGIVTDFGADKGYDVLKNIIETDEGSKRLGEVALVPYDSPIREMNLLFYETLFDENASCHFALGAAYASSVKGGEKKSEQDLPALGLNVSSEHVDFMVGTRDLSITATKKDGSKFTVFTDGNFVK